MTSYVGSLHSQYPYSAVCEVVATFKDGASFQGSGVFVSANDVLTASHMLWQTDHGGAATSVTVYAGRDGASLPFGAHSAAQWNYYQINDHLDQISHSDAQFDVGIISLATNDRLGAQTGTFGMDPNAHSGNYILTGYPTGPDRMTNDSGYVKEDANYFTFDYQDFSSHPGSSGGPLWYLGAAGPYVVGVCSGGIMGGEWPMTAWAADISKTYAQLQAWIHQDGVW